MKRFVIIVSAVLLTLAANSCGQNDKMVMDRIQYDIDHSCWYEVTYVDGFRDTVCVSDSRAYVQTYKNSNVLYFGYYEWDGGCEHLSVTGNILRARCVHLDPPTPEMHRSYKTLIHE